MQAVILAGGRGTRLGEISSIKPKPMVEIGGKPIIWHIMKLYAFYGVKEFIICAGYLGYEIKDYFANYLLKTSDLDINFQSNSINYMSKEKKLDWSIKIIDTGEKTLTAGRLKKIKKYLHNDKPFFMTYGDGLSDVNIKKQLKFHQTSKKLVTMTAVYPPPRFGSIILKNNLITKFSEKNVGDEGRINGGFFVCEKKCLDFVTRDEPWEGAPLIKISESKELMAFEHDGFWQPMDTMRERDYLDMLWKEKKAPWKVWN